jgi:quercetin dioxygenase-like cupin family protein
MEQDNAVPVGELQRVNAYTEYQRGEGIPVVRGFAIGDLRTVEVKPWARKGGSGTFINLDGTGGNNDAYVCEIPPGQSLRPQRHLFEEMIYVLEGVGSTTVWYREDRTASFEWKAGSLFAVPLNAWHRHYNLRGTRPARYVAVTTAPIVMNLFHNTEFVFDNPFTFEDRFTHEQDYFRDGQLFLNQKGNQHIWTTNFVPDANAVHLYSRAARGAGGRMAFFEMAHNTTCAHISEFPAGTYKKGHRHGPGAHVIVLSGQGYSLLWPEGNASTQVDWQAGSMVVPPNQWFHQHFNTGPEPARYLALRWGGSKRYAGLSTTGANNRLADAYVDLKQGGSQIEYADEDPQIHQQFEAALGRSGALCRMRSMVPWCGGQV